MWIIAITSIVALTAIHQSTIAIFVVLYLAAVLILFSQLNQQRDLRGYYLLAQHLVQWLQL